MQQKDNQPSTFTLIIRTAGLFASVGGALVSAWSSAVSAALEYLGYQPIVDYQSAGLAFIASVATFGITLYCIASDDDGGPHDGPPGGGGRPPQGPAGMA